MRLLSQTIKSLKHALSSSSDWISSKRITDAPTTVVCIERLEDNNLFLQKIKSAGNTTGTSLPGAPTVAIAQASAQVLGQDRLLVLGQDQVQVMGQDLPLVLNNSQGAFWHFKFGVR